MDYYKLTMNYNMGHFKLDDWVIYDKKGYCYSAFITGFDFNNKKVKIFLVNSKNINAMDLNCRKEYWVKYGDIEHMHTTITETEEQLKSAIDLALDLKDKKLFNLFSTELNILNETFTF